MVPPRLPRCATCGLDSERRGRGSGEPVHADHGPDLQDALLTRSSIRSRPQSLLAKPYLLPTYGGGEARSTADSPVAEGGIAGAPSPTLPRRSSNQGWMAALGHEDPFPRPRPSGRYRFGQETFAGVRGNGRDAPLTDIRSTIERARCAMIRLTCWISRKTQKTVQSQAQPIAVKLGRA